MTDEDERLLAHYLAVGREAWNTSREAAWLDYALRTRVRDRLPAQHPIDVCNVGIGVGHFDDWLGHELQLTVTSVDRDPEICALFEMRQRRERHPFPARVVCGDVLDGVLGEARFDVITSVGSTLGESGADAAMLAAMRRALRPSGELIVVDVRSDVAGLRVDVAI